MKKMILTAAALATMVGVVSTGATAQAATMAIQQNETQVMPSQELVVPLQDIATPTREVTPRTIELQPANGPGLVIQKTKEEGTAVAAEATATVLEPEKTFFQRVSEYFTVSLKQIWQ